MNDHTSLLTTFYRAFQARDGATMAACYHPEAHFSDPVFNDLSASEAGAMWTMLCKRGQDLRVEFKILSANENTARVHWEAWYTFSGSGNKVHNIIEADFTLRDGKIIRHTDHFNFPRWARQALGFKGWLLGHTAFLKRAVQERAARSLREFVASTQSR